MKAFLVNAINSWVTSAAGAVIGRPELWAGLQPMLDGNDSTSPDLSLILKGGAILLVGFFARDWTKNVLKK